jgi:hypothetical protein
MLSTSCCLHNKISLAASALLGRRINQNEIAKFFRGLAAEASQKPHSLCRERFWRLSSLGNPYRQTAESAHHLAICTSGTSYGRQPLFSTDSARLRRQWADSQEKRNARLSISVIGRVSHVGAHRLKTRCTTSGDRVIMNLI